MIRSNKSDIIKQFNDLIIVFIKQRYWKKNANSCTNAGQFCEIYCMGLLKQNL